VPQCISTFSCCWPPSVGTGRVERELRGVEDVDLLDRIVNGSPGVVFGAPLGYEKRMMQMVPASRQ
jgi:hypothetical protein